MCVCVCVCVCESVRECERVGVRLSERVVLQVSNHKY